MEKQNDKETSFIDRLYDEREELDKRLKKLSVFIESDKFETAVPSIRHRRLLIRQRYVMTEYLRILSERLKLTLKEN